MADKKKTMAVIRSQENITKDIFSMWLEFEANANVVNSAVPGQFISMYSADGSRLLPRPISICEIDKVDEIPVVGPLGNGFTLKGGKAVLIGGGIGIPPMLELAKSLNSKENVSVVLGYRDNDLFLKDEFEPYANVYVSTEDGSVGTKGNVIDAIKENGLDADVLYSCGPIPMLRGVKAYAKEKGIEAQISMEEKMACGIGACLGCVCKSKDIDEHSKVHNKRICKDGPVFNAEDIEI